MLGRHTYGELQTVFPFQCLFLIIVEDSGICFPQILELFTYVDNFLIAARKFNCRSILGVDIDSGKICTLNFSAPIVDPLLNFTKYIEAVL